MHSYHHWQALTLQIFKTNFSSYFQICDKTGFLRDNVCMNENISNHKYMLKLLYFFLASVKAQDTKPIGLYGITCDNTAPMP